MENETLLQTASFVQQQRMASTAMLAYASASMFINPYMLMAEDEKELYADYWMDDSNLLDVLNGRLELGLEDGPTRSKEGDHILSVQFALLSLGYVIDLRELWNQKYGSSTREAVIAYQKASNLNPDGLVGNMTMEKLDMDVALVEQDHLFVGREAYRSENPEMIKFLDKDEAVQKRLAEMRKLCGPKMYWQTAGKVLKMLQDTYDDSPREFAYYVLQLELEGHLDHILNQLNVSLIGDHGFILTRIMVHASFDGAMDAGKGWAKRYLTVLPSAVWLAPFFGVHPSDAMPGVLQHDLRRSGLIDLINIEPEVLKEEIGTLMEDILVAKIFEIEYLAQHGRWDDIADRFVDFLMVSDTAFELLFEEELTHIDIPLLEGTIFDKINARARRQPRRTPAIDITNHAQGHKGKPLKKILHPQQPPKSEVKPGNQSDKANESGGEQEEALTPSRKETVKKIIVREANRFREFFYEEVVSLSDKYPKLLEVLNQRLEQVVKPEVAAKKDNWFGKNQDTWDWMDLSRFWFYEMGDPSIGSEENPLTFGPDAYTTQEIMKHESIEALREYIRFLGRTTGGVDDFRAAVKYRVPEFWAAIKARDKAFNFLGSFRVDVEVLSMSISGSYNYEYELRFSVFNRSSLESASRFRANEPGKDGKLPVIDNIERNQEDTLHIGGNLNTVWEWTETIPFFYFD